MKQAKTMLKRIMVIALAITLLGAPTKTFAESMKDYKAWNIPTKINITGKEISGELPRPISGEPNRNVASGIPCPDTAAY